MTEQDIEKLLSGKQLDLKTLEKRLEAVTNSDKEELSKLLNHMLMKGVIGAHDKAFYLLKDQRMTLAKVTVKKRNFVIAKTIPDMTEVRLSGDEADGLLIGDTLYLTPIQGIMHAVDYLCPVSTFKGRYSLDEKGKEMVLVDYLNEAGKQILVSEKAEDLGLNQGDLVEAQILSYSGKTYTVKVTKLLVKASDVGSDISMIITEADAPLVFPDEVVAEAKAIPQELAPEDYKDRADLREQCVVTIDGKDAHDFDDAVSGTKLGEGYEITVSIADVTHYVKPTHPLDDEAKNRSTSIYVADRVVPMLPFELSNGICSLNPNVDRLVLSVVMDLDPMGNVFHSEIKQGVIRSHGRLNYDEVNDFFAGKDVPELSKEIKDTLTLLHEASIAVRKRRERQGAMRLDSTELKFQLDENGDPTSVTKVVQGPSEKMIEDLMILANVEVAKQLKNAGIPVLYRVHEYPPMAKFADFKDFLKKTSPKLLHSFPKRETVSGAKLNDFLDQIPDAGTRSVVSYMLLRMMAKARYSPEELGHFGLAEPYYCHFTSPIRRYPDDIVHRLIHEYLLDHKTFQKDEVYNRLLTLGDNTSGCEVRADKIERTVDDLESAKYMSKHIGETFHGKVTGLISRGMFIEMDLGIEGFLPYHCMHGDFFNFDDRSYSAIGKYHPEVSFSIGTPIDVAVLDTNIEEHEIDLATPEFFKQNALDLSEEQRAKLALDGIQIRSDDSDYRSLTGKARVMRNNMDENEEEIMKKVLAENKPEEPEDMEDREEASAPEEEGMPEEERQPEEEKEPEEELPAEPVKKPAARVHSRSGYGKADFDEEDKEEQAGRDDDRPSRFGHSDFHSDRDRRGGHGKFDHGRPVDTRGFDSQAREFHSDRDDRRNEPVEHKGYSAMERPSYQDRVYGDRPSYGDRGGRGGYSDRGGRGGYSDRGGRGGYGDRPSYGRSEGGYRGHSDFHSDRGGRGSYGDRPSYGRSEGGYRGHSDFHSDRGGRGSYGDRPSYGRSEGGYRGHSDFHSDRQGGSSDRRGYGRPEGSGERRDFHAGDRGSFGHSSFNHGFHNDSHNGGYAGHREGGSSYKGGRGGAGSRGGYSNHRSGGFRGGRTGGYRGGHGSGSDRGGSSR